MYKTIILLLTTCHLFASFTADCSKPCTCASKAKEQRVEYSPESKSSKVILQTYNYTPQTVLSP